MRSKILIGFVLLLVMIPLSIVQARILTYEEAKEDTVNDINSFEYFTDEARAGWLDKLNDVTTYVELDNFNQEYGFVKSQLLFEQELVSGSLEEELIYEAQRLEDTYPQSELRDQLISDMRNYQFTTYSDWELLEERITNFDSDYYSQFETDAESRYQKILDKVNFEDPLPEIQEAILQRLSNWQDFDEQEWQEVDAFIRDQLSLNNHLQDEDPNASKSTMIEYLRSDVAYAFFEDQVGLGRVNNLIDQLMAMDAATEEFFWLRKAIQSELAIREDWVEQLPEQEQTIYRLRRAINGDLPPGDRYNLLMAHAENLRELPYDLYLEKSAVIWEAYSDSSQPVPSLDFSKLPQDYYETISLELNDLPALGTLGLAEGAGPRVYYKDIWVDDPFYDATNFFTELGALKGYIDRTFRPNFKISRVEALKIILLAAEIEVDEDYQADFNDVPADFWGRGVIAEGMSRGIVSGDDQTGTFRPNDTVNLAEALKMIALANDLQLTAPELPPYPNVDADAWFAIYAAWSAENELLDSEYFHAGQELTRGQFVELMYKVVQALDGDQEQ